jgi:acyl carrier protein
VKLRGFRIELGEIESVLMRHEGIKAACALVREDTPGDAYIAGYYVAKAGQAASNQDLSGFLRRHLPEYMVPSRFVQLERFPLTPNGKIDRRALPAPATQKRAVKDAAGPMTPMQRLVVEVWEAALGTEGIRVQDNFYDLGGHSLLSMQVIKELEERTGVRITPRAMVFQSLGQVAAYYEQNKKPQREERSMNWMNRLSSALHRVLGGA